MAAVTTIEVKEPGEDEDGEDDGDDEAGVACLK